MKIISNENYTFLDDDNKVITDQGDIKFCDPFFDLTLLPYSKIIHWSLIENCNIATPSFYAVYPYDRSEINELIFATDAYSRSFCNSYRYFDEGDLIVFADGLFQYVDSLLEVLPVNNIKLTEEFIEEIYLPY